MPPRGNESFVRRQKEIARQKRQQEKAAKREERRANPRTKSSDEISPDELATIGELTGLPEIEPEAEPQSDS